MCCLAFLGGTTAIVIITVEGKYVKKEVNVSLFRCRMSASRTARETLRNMKQLARIDVH